MGAGAIGGASVFSDVCLRYTGVGMADSIAAVVLAGVHDWGACPLHQAIVRPLVPVANKPVIHYGLLALQQAGARRAVVCTNAPTSQLAGVLGPKPISRLHVEYQNERMPRGPAGCVLDAMTCGIDATDVIVVAEAAVVPHFDVWAMVRVHVAARASLTIATRTASPAVSDDDSQIPVGIYCFSRDALEHVRPKGFEDIKEGLVPRLHAAGKRVDVYPIAGLAPRLSGVGSYFALNEWAIGQTLRGVWETPGYAMDGTALIHIDARVHRAARLLGPVMIGSGVVIEQDALIVGPASIDRNCVVREGAVISRSILWEAAQVDAWSHVDRCIITQNARVQAHTQQFNSVCLSQAHGPVNRMQSAVHRASDEPVPPPTHKSTKTRSPF